MTRGGGTAAFALIATLFGVIACLGCSKGDESKPKHTFDLTGRVVPATPPSPAPAPSAPVVNPAPRGNVAPETEVEPGAAAPPASRPAPAPAPSASAAKANPDEPILAQARTACGRCFLSLPASAGAPDRSAHVSFTVVSTGTVSRADVTSDDTPEASVLDCVQKTAQSVVFSDNGDGPLRTYAIDVRVHASPSNGGR